MSKVLLEDLQEGQGRAQNQNWTALPSLGEKNVICLEEILSWGSFATISLGA